MKKSAALMGVFLLGICTTLIAQRLKFTINEGWKFQKGEVPLAEQIYFFETEKWQTVHLPHTWNNIDALDDEDGYYAGIGWYRKIFILPQSAQNKKIYLFFEGANQITDVFVNGNFVGRHEGGYTAFRFDITDKIFFNRPNLLAVRVDNRVNSDIAPLSADFTFFGGIYRDVFLEIVEPLHFEMMNYASDGVFVRTQKDKDQRSFEVHLSGELRNEHKTLQKSFIRITLKDSAGRTVVQKTQEKPIILKPFEKQSFYISFGVENPKLWSPESPYLYKVEVELLNQTKETRHDFLNITTAFRWFRLDAQKGFFLNDKPLKLLGANRHQDYPSLGNALPDELHLQDMKLLKEMGANFIRIAHYPQDPVILESCDRLGIIAWEEIPIVNEISYTERFKQTSYTQVVEMIRQHYNHPSIVMWGFMNEILLARFHQKEVFEANKSRIASLARYLDSVARAEDPYRYTVIAHHSDYEAYKSLNLIDVTQICGWNLYFGWYVEGFEKFEEFIKRATTEFPQTPIIISEYGAGCDERIHAHNPSRFDFSVEWFELFHQKYLKAILQTPQVTGAAIWNFVDFNSEGRKDTNPHINNKGILKYNREKKDIFYFYKAMLSEEPVLKIATSDWRLRTAIVPKNESVVLQPITVYSNCSDVELMLNGVSLGKKQPDSLKKCVFDVAMVNGRNELSCKAIGKNGKIVKDLVWVTMKFIPENLADETFEEINVNVGSHFDFVEQQKNLVWIAEKPYTKGSWGYIGGNRFMTWNGSRVGTEKEIFGTDREPLYQTQRDSLQGFRFDVANGSYELELHFAELLSEKEKKIILNNLEADAAKAPELIQREFDVWINEKLYLENLNIAKQYGEHRAVAFKFHIFVENDKGIEIKFVPKKGNPILNGVRLRKLP
ncbi:MAG: malectin domain-containing carbohydrate-binding protein [Cytophagales bacterium]|nr:malectin domain-containing carbohydrate-binding protein [Cytophagales bacterium]MDW8383303.1 glycoside hydrolase family 2 TIM barrel-domain containing protein [Flammeovirgaceae bacterium]